MAINVYSGLMGHGKSYEVVENVILPAILQGRRIVTNIAGLQVDDIHSYLAEKNDVDLDKLGAVVVVENDDISKPDFFPSETKEGEIPPSSVVSAGDLLVLDEVWRFWGAGSKIDPSHMHFFRMHRHFVDPESSNTCDIALIVQDVQDLHRNLKVVVENTYKMTKLKAIGMPTRYRVDVYQSYRVHRPPINSFQRKYNKHIFLLYKSYSQGTKSGNEVPIDNRGNILNNSFFKIILPILLLIVLPFSLYQVYSFFTPKSSKPSTASPASPSSSPRSSSQLPPSPPLKSEWRILGYYQIGYYKYVFVFQPPDKYRTLVNPPGFSVDGIHISGFLDGAPVSNWSGISSGVSSSLFSSSPQSSRSAP